MNATSLPSPAESVASLEAPPPMPRPSPVERALSAPLRRLLERLARRVQHGALTVHLPGGERLESHGPQPGTQAVLHIVRWRALWRLMSEGDLGFARAYARGDWHTPDLVNLLGFALENESAWGDALQGQRWARALARVGHLLRANTRRGSRDNIAFHYDLGNSFYAQWLDRQMLYSSALYQRGDESLEQAQEARLQEEFSSIATTLAGLPQVLCHRDFHSRNIMIKGERIYFIDFQDARLGPPQYDLVSLVHDSYVQISDANATRLIEYYLEQFPEALQMFNGKKDFMHFFALQMLQRCFKACGTFAAVLNQRGDRRYLKYLPHTLQKVNAALSELGGYPNLTALVKNLKLPQIEKWP